MLPRILLVTYDRDLSSIYCNELVKEGYAVSRTFNEDTAIAYLGKTEHHFDLIIMDHDPVIINGILATIEMRRIDPAAKVLLMAENRKSRDFARFCGAFDLIRKPKTIEEFLLLAGRYTQAKEQQLGNGGEIISEKIFQSTKENSSIESPRNGKEIDGEKSPVEEISLDGQPSPPFENIRPKPRQRRLRSNRNIASAIFAFLLLGVLLWNSHSTEASTQNTAMIVVDVHVIHIMETKDFVLFFNGELKFSGVTGNGTYLHLLLDYMWNTTDSAILYILALSDSGSAQSHWAESLDVSAGGTFYVYIRL